MPPRCFDWPMKPRVPRRCEPCDVSQRSVRIHNRHGRGTGWRLQFALAVFVVTTAQTWGQDRPRGNEDGTARPWMTFCVARLDHLLDHVDVLLQAADRPELSEVLSNRYRSWQDFGGIDRTRPLGLLWAWRSDDPETEDQESHEELLFVPIKTVEPLLKTVTFDIVPYREVTPGHFEIERPGSPYHAIVRDEVLWLGDDPTTLRRFSTKLKSLTNDLVREFDMAVAWDLRQVPTERRQRWVEEWRLGFEPLLQRRDDEPEESHVWRARLGRAFIGFVTEALSKLDRVVVGVKINTLRRRAEVQIRLEGDVNAAGMASWLAWPARKTSMMRLDIPDAFAFGSVQIPWANGIAAERPDRNAAAEMAWQVFGDPYSDRATVIALRIPGLPEECERWPAATGDTFRAGEVVFRRIQDLPIPQALRRFTGWDPECWCGIRQDVVWWGFGPPEPVSAALKKALIAVEEPAVAQFKPTAMQVRMSARDLVPYLQIFSHGWADGELQKGEDQVKLRVEPHAKGITAHLQLDAGLLRLLGASMAEDLAAELEHMMANP
ncbi:MAG: hypothetical protein Q8K78_13815 [Planctomycetaceae bacterium]|nr:hypothetical protein [Planctomycetaceae bacterium]